MTEMALHWFKGPVFSLYDQVLSGTQAARMGLLAELKRDQPPTAATYDPHTSNPAATPHFLDRVIGTTKMWPSVGSKLDPFYPKAPMNTEAGRLEHLNLHWFGAKTVAASGAYLTHQDPWNAASPKQTGEWEFFHGDVSEIYRQGIITALEVSMGLDPFSPLAGQNPTRNLPISVFWICGSDRFETYVSWLANAVSLHIVTPGFGISYSELSQKDSVTGADEFPEITADSLKRDTGSVAIGHDTVKVEHVKSWISIEVNVGLLGGSIALPVQVPFWVGQKDVTRREITDEYGAAVVVP